MGKPARFFSKSGTDTFCTEKYQKVSVPDLLLVLLSIVVFLIFPLNAYSEYAKGNVFSYARSGDLSSVKIILKNNSDKNILNQALGAAVVGNQVKIINYLIDCGADVNHISSFGSPILLNAIAIDNAKATEALVKAGADINIKGMKLVIHGIFVNWQWTPLMAAAYKGNLKLTKLLLKKGADINERGWSSSPDEPETAADIAAYSGHLKVLKYLLKKKSDISQNAIFLAARGGHIDIVEFFLVRGTNINAPGELYSKTLLMEASWWGHPSLVHFLIKEGSQINLINENGYTALAEAISNSNEDFLSQFEIVKILVENGADIHLTGKFKMTPLMLAVEVNDKRIIEYLKGKGAQE